MIILPQIIIIIIMIMIIIVIIMAIVWGACSRRLTAPLPLASRFRA